MPSFFQQQQEEQAIQLADESRQQQKTSSWAASFACCVPLKTGMIHLPDDSDEEQEQLLRNDSIPFERSMPTAAFNNEHDVQLADDSLSIKQDTTEELTDIARFSRSQYADVPDWTEMYSDEEESTPGYIINEEVGESSFTSNNTTLHEEQQELDSFSKTDQQITEEIPSHELVDTKIPETENAPNKDDPLNDEQVMQDGDTEDNTALLSSSPIQEQMDDFENNEDLDPNKEPEQEESVTPNHVQTDANEPIINEYLADEASLQPPAIDKEEGEDDEEDEEDEDEENEEHKEVTANDREEHAGSQEPEEPVINEEDTSIKQKEPMTDEEETPTATNQDSVITNDETGNDGEDKKEEYKFAIDTKANEVEAIDNSSIKTNDESPSTSKPIDTKNKDIEDEETAQNNRRSSVVATAAQSILGDKLDDFTEKLAFIKKNIIMSVDSDEEYDDEDNNVIATKKENIRQQNRRSVSSVQSDFSLFGGSKQPDTTSAAAKNGHRRASSLMDVAPSLARFMNQIGNDNENNTTNTSQNTNTTHHNRTFSPSSLFSSFAGPMPESSANLKRKESITTLREVPNEEDEELFDFTKVIEIGKNVRTFSEDIVGNGFRMFNDVANRMKSSVEQQDKKSENISAEDEWMHNYL